MSSLCTRVRLTLAQHETPSCSFLSGQQLRDSSLIKVYKHCGYPIMTVSIGHSVLAFNVSTIFHPFFIPGHIVNISVSISCCLLFHAHTMCSAWKLCSLNPFKQHSQPVLFGHRWNARLYRGQQNGAAIMLFSNKNVIVKV